MSDEIKYAYLENLLTEKVGTIIQIENVNYTFDYDMMIGTFFFSGDNETMIYSTPFWEGTDGISFEIHEDDDIKYDSIEFDVVNNEEIDIQNFFDTMKSFLEKM